MKSLIPVFLLLLLFSCSNDDETNTGRILPTPIIEFVTESNTVSHISDGSTYQDQVTVRLVNSEFYYFDESIEFTLRVDQQNSTAVEGVDFNFTPNTYTFNKFNDYTQKIDIEILTEEVYISETKEIVFIAQEVVNNTEVSGIFTINYECFVDLTGTYNVTNDFGIALGYPSVTRTAVITRADNGKWYLTAVAGAFQIYTTYDGPSFGNIVVNCDVVESSNDIHLISDNYIVGNVLGGTWNQETGVLKMSHSQNLNNVWPTNWNSRYVRQ